MPEVRVVRHFTSHTILKLVFCPVGVCQTCVECGSCRVYSTRLEQAGRLWKHVWNGAGTSFQTK